ncbi:LysR family transcriptional regulator [Krasilnikovia sp. MM14-A1259]|uniref:LysR family transcriptional regulator n=1 Tax=Krasilnikovia sp. MM14-A1259 TaxID=3373539 RepID=UPI00382ABC45
MELRQLAYFEAVARCGGFTRAAEQLHVAQSAVSAQIRALETELGVPLFSRTTRRVSLTHAGELFLARARRALGELDSARAELADLTAVLHGRVTIGATPVTGPFDLPDALARFHTRYPGVALTLRSGLISELLAELDTGGVDFVLGPIHRDLASRYSARRIADEDIVVVLPVGHHLARERRVGFAQLRDEAFVCLTAGSGLRSILDDAASAAGFTAHVQFETHSPASIRELVGAGLGVALLARAAAERDGAPVVVRTLEPAPGHPPIGLIHHRDHRLSAAAQACRGHLIELATA